MLFNPVRSAMCLAIAGCLLNGCAMYSETRDKQGQALKEAYAKVDLKSQFSVPRKNRAGILEQQIATVDRLEIIRRDGMIRAAATARDQTVLGMLNTMSTLSGADALFGKRIDGDTESEQIDSRRQRAEMYLGLASVDPEVVRLRGFIAGTLKTEFTRRNVTQPSCEDIRDNAKPKLAVDDWIAAHAGQPAAKDIANLMTYMKKSCDELLAAQDTQRARTLGGNLGTVSALLIKEKADLKALEDKTKDDRGEADRALKDRDTAEENDDKDGVRTAAARAEKALAQIKKATDVFSIQFLSDKEQDAIDEFLSTVQNTPPGETPKADSSKAAMAVVLFPDLMIAAQKKLEEVDSISLAPLVLQKKLSRIAYDSATRDIETRTERIALLQQQTDLLLAQAREHALTDAKIASMRPAVLHLPLSEVLAPPETVAAGKAKVKPTIDEQMAVWRALATYIDEGVRHGGEISKIQFRLDALDSEIALGYSEANVTQWDTLISANVEQLAAYGAAGVKVEQITALINSLTLLWIGSGVN